MGVQSLSLLRHFESDLVEHFKNLRTQRADKPVFLIEHGLDDEKLGEMRRNVGVHARLAGLASENWIGASLPLAIAITETGYRYRGTGTEFWPRFAGDIGAGINQAERADIRRLFERLSKKLAAASPNDSDWARAFNIIAWPIRNALAPIEIHRPLAEALGRLAAADGHNLPNEDFQRRLLAIADGLWSRRLSDWLRDGDLAVGLCRNLLTGEDAPTWIEPTAAARIAKDIRTDGECRQALRQARRIVRTSSSSNVELSPASWSLSVLKTEDGTSIERLLLVGPLVLPRMREAALARLGRLGRSATMRVSGSEGHPLLMEQFLSGEAIEFSSPSKAWGDGLLTADSVEPGKPFQDLIKSLTPAPPHLFLWSGTGGLLNELKRGTTVGSEDLVLSLNRIDDDDVRPVTPSFEVYAPEGLIARVANAGDCKHLLTRCGVRIEDDQLVAFTGATRLQIEGNRVVSSGDAPVFLRASKSNIQVSLTRSVSRSLTLSAGDVLQVPASSAGVEIEILHEGRSETWHILQSPDIQYSVFNCHLRPSRATLDDFLSGEISIYLSSSIPLDETPIDLEILLNDERLAIAQSKIQSLPNHIDCFSAEFTNLREAAFAALATAGECTWSLRLNVENIMSFDFALQSRRGSWEHMTGPFEWIDENGAIARPGRMANALSPLTFHNDVSLPDFETEEIQLWLPDIPGTTSLVEGVLTGKAKLFGQAGHPELGMISRTPERFRENPGVIATCEALIAWRSASAKDMLVDSRRGTIVDFLDIALTAAFCGDEWVKAERDADKAAAGFAALLATEAFRARLARGPGFPKVEPADHDLFVRLLAVRFEAVLPVEHPSDRLLDDDAAMALDEAINQAYCDLSVILVDRGYDPLEETDAGNELNAWILANETTQNQFSRSPFRRLVLPQSRWESLFATRYEGLADEDLVGVLMRSHLDISRVAGREWIGPSALRTGLLLWLSPADLLEIEDWQQHLSHLLSDRHTSRAIRFVALRNRSRQPVLSNRPTEALQ